MKYCVRMRKLQYEAKYYKKQNGFRILKCVYDAFSHKINYHVTLVNVNNVDPTAK